MIAGHLNPDGDSIGSLLALGLGLAGMGKDVHMVSKDGVPRVYRKLPGAAKVKRAVKEVPDMAITVDCNTAAMVGEPFAIMKKAKYILEIDHHEFRKPFGNISFVDTKAAAVGELVYRLLISLGVKITRDIAQNILTSIIVETNSFRLPAVRPLTFSLCARLLKTGVDFSRLSDLIYWSKTRQSAMLSGLCMSRLKFAENEKIAWSMVTRKDFSGAKAKDEDVDTVANDILSIEGVKVAVFFREKSASLLRVSIRSKGGINVAAVASLYGGGGHFDSAGCYIANNKRAREGLLKVLKEKLK